MLKYLRAIKPRPSIKMIKVCGPGTDVDGSATKVVNAVWFKLTIPRPSNRNPVTKAVGLVGSNMSVVSIPKILNLSVA